MIHVAAKRFPQLQVLKEAEEKLDSRALGFGTDPRFENHQPGQKRQFVTASQSEVLEVS